HSTVTLDVLASPANAPVITGVDYVGETIVFDRRRLASYLPTALRLRRAKYDAVIDCMVTAPSLTTLLLILASGARHRVGIAGRGNDAAFTITVPPETRADAHMVDHLAALVAAFSLDPSAADVGPALHLTDAERTRAEAEWRARGGEDADGPRVLINISAGTAARRWAESNYVAVMRRLRERDL